MPIPSPRSNEEQNKYMKRCMTWMSKNNEFEEGNTGEETQKQRVAVCLNTWRGRGDTKIDKQIRIDRGEIKDWAYNEEDGVLTADVKIIKSQVLPYRDSGKTIYEFLPPEELKADSFLNSIKSKPVTDEHPEDRVDFDNLGEHAKGTIHNNMPEVKENGQVEVWVKETIYDADLIEAIRSGQKKQVSVGRLATIEEKSGEYNGVKYDRIQREMELNHLAHVPQGRAGSDVEIKLDGAIISTEFNQDHGGITMTEKKKKQDKDFPKEIKITIDGEDYHFDAKNKKQEDKLNEFADTLKAKDTKIDELEETKKGLVDEFNNLNSKLSFKVEDGKLVLDESDTDDEIEDESEEDNTGMTKEELEEIMEDREKQLSDKLNKKFDMIERIRRFIPDYRPDFDKNKTDLIKDFLLKLDKFEEDDLEDKSDAYIEARFDIEIENLEDDQSKPVGRNLLKTDKSSDDESDNLTELKDKRKNLYNDGGDE